LPALGVVVFEWVGVDFVEFLRLVVKSSGSVASSDNVTGISTMLLPDLGVDGVFTAMGIFLGSDDFGVMDIASAVMGFVMHPSDFGQRNSSETSSDKDDGAMTAQEFFPVDIDFFGVRVVEVLGVPP
jgi:hypothetical protein